MPTSRCCLLLFSLHPPAAKPPAPAPPTPAVCGALPRATLPAAAAPHVPQQVRPAPALPAPHPLLPVGQACPAFLPPAACTPAWPASGACIGTWWRRLPVRSASTCAVPTCGTIWRYCTAGTTWQRGCGCTPRRPGAWSWATAGGSRWPSARRRWAQGAAVWLLPVSPSSCHLFCTLCMYPPPPLCSLVCTLFMSPTALAVPRHGGQTLAFAHAPAACSSSTAPTCTHMPHLLMLPACTRTHACSCSLPAGGGLLHRTEQGQQPRCARGGLRLHRGADVQGGRLGRVLAESVVYAWEESCACMPGNGGAGAGTRCRPQERPPAPAASSAQPACCASCPLGYAGCRAVARDQPPRSPWPPPGAVTATAATAAAAALQVDRQAVSPFVPRLLRALLMCFKDASWPVRDAACLACGRCVTAFPEESREVLEVRLAGWWGWPAVCLSVCLAGWPEGRRAERPTCVFCLQNAWRRRRPLLPPRPAPGPPAEPRRRRRRRRRPSPPPLGAAALCAGALLPLVCPPVGQHLFS